mgnify:CR=1 FL=1
MNINTNIVIKEMTENKNNENIKMYLNSDDSAHSILSSGENFIQVKSITTLGKRTGVLFL